MGESIITLEIAGYSDGGRWPGLSVVHGRSRVHRRRHGHRQQSRSAAPGHGVCAIPSHGYARVALSAANLNSIELM